MAHSTRDLTPAADCVFGARHLPPRIYVTPLGEKKAGIDWQDRVPRKKEEYYKHHPVYNAGQDRPCRICGRLSMLRDCQGKPCHKGCAEDELLAGLS